MCQKSPHRYNRSGRICLLKKMVGCHPSTIIHDNVIKCKHFPRYWPFVRGIHRSPMNSLHKGQWRGVLMFSLICVCINNHEAGDLRRYRTHYDVTVMCALKDYRHCRRYCYLLLKREGKNIDDSVHRSKKKWLQFLVPQYIDCVNVANNKNLCNEREVGSVSFKTVRMNIL